MAKKVNNLAKQPFYHLRPNKSIDRSLFVQTLIGLSREIPISDYKYTGFGSYLFDDFKILHDTLNISNMVSLENDKLEFQRAQFNSPYGCISIKNIESTQYISDLSIQDGEHNIFWLDYVRPAELGTQLSDYSTLLNLLNPDDIVRITLNANPDSLGKCQNPDQLQEHRLQTLKERVPDTYICPSFMLPLFSSVYADGQQMVTFTGIVLDSHEKEARIREALKNYPHNTFMWDTPSRIEIPALSVREITELNKLLPSSDARQQLIEHFPFIFPEKEGQAVDSYIAYYKYYPNYHKVSF